MKTKGFLSRHAVGLLGVVIVSLAHLPYLHAALPIPTDAVVCVATFLPQSLVFSCDGGATVTAQQQGPISLVKTSSGALSEFKSAGLKAATCTQDSRDAMTCTLYRP